MSKKQRGSKHERFVSKNQLPGQQQPRRVRKIVILIALVVIVAVVGAVGWIIYNSQVQPYHQAAIRINDVTFNMRYFINTLKLYYGEAPTGTSIFDFADQVEQQIEQNEIIRLGSLALGVQIKRSDIEAKLKKSGTPVTTESVDILMAQELITKQIPENQPQVHVQAMLLESEEAAQLAKARLQDGEAFDKVAEELTKEGVTKIGKGDLGWVTARHADLMLISTKFGDMVLGSNAGVLSGPVYDDTVSKDFGYWVAKVTEKIEADDTTLAQIHIQGILLGTEQEAEDVMDKLNTGADFNELAKQVSQYLGAQDNGAELGWATQSEDNSDFYKALFDLPLDTVSGPIPDDQVKTMGGYWVFNVLEKDSNRALTKSQQSRLEKDLLDRFNAKMQEDPNYKVENLLTQEMKDFALNEVVASLGEGAVLVRTRSLPNAEVGVPYLQKLEVFGSNRSNTWSITTGSLPAGLSLDGSTGVISGTPTKAGGAGFTVEVSSGLMYGTQELFINIYLAVSVTTTSLPDGQVGVAYYEALEAFGGSENYNWSIIAGSLPDGLSLDESIGVISGTPTKAGTTSCTVQVDDGLAKATQVLSTYIMANE